MIPPDPPARGTPVKRFLVIGTTLTNHYVFTRSTDHDDPLSAGPPKVPETNVLQVPLFAPPPNGLLQPVNILMSGGFISRQNANTRVLGIAEPKRNAKA